MRGPDCHNLSLTAFDDWSVTCGADSKGDLTITSSQDLVSGPNLSDQCWETVEIGSDVTVTLTDLDNPYRFKKLQFADKSTSRLQIPTLSPGKRRRVVS